MDAEDRSKGVPAVYQPGAGALTKVLHIGGERGG